MAAGALVKVTQPELSIEEQIRNRAYELSLQREGATGSALQDWLQAEKEVLGAGGAESV